MISDIFIVSRWLKGRVGVQPIRLLVFVGQISRAPFGDSLQEGNAKTTRVKYRLV